jgi:hypothetical protein
MTGREAKNSNDIFFVCLLLWLSRKIENFNSSIYYENPDYIFQAFGAGDVLV